MMPSHSMDLPVPRGTSILMLGGVKNNPIFFFIFFFFVLMEKSCF